MKQEFPQIKAGNKSISGASLKIIQNPLYFSAYINEFSAILNLITKLFSDLKKN